MLLKFSGIILVLGGILFIRKFKTFRYMPNPEPFPDTKETTINYGNLIIGICLIILGILLILGRIE